MTWLRMRQPTWLCKLCYIMSNFFLPKKGAPGTTKGRKVKADKKVGMPLKLSKCISDSSIAWCGIIRILSS